jgi:hypothetical protein
MRRELNIKEWKSPIPKKIHFIWIGGDQPDYFKKFLRGFQQLNPEFEIKVWGNKELNKKHFPITFPYIQICKKMQGKVIKEWTNAPIMYKSDDSSYKYNKWAQITDLMRLEIVFREGGYYFDTTFECLKPLYSLFNKKKISFVGCNEFPRFKNSFSLSNSFFGATKGNVILKRLLSKRKLNKIDFRSAVVSEETGPAYLRSGIQLSDNYKIFPSTYFYPFVEEYQEGENYPYRKAEKNKCHGTKRTKKKTIRLKNKKGYLEYPCKKYPKSYALKHWQLGKSWLIQSYYTHEGSKKQAGGSPIPCIPCAAVAVSNPIGAGIAAAGACVYGGLKAYKCLKKKLTKRGKKQKKKKKSKSKTKGKSKTK